MAVYGEIKFDVSLDEETIQDALVALNDYNVRHAFIIIETTNGGMLIFDTKERTVNNFNVQWETVLSDEAC
ncbi:hypothetical protein [Metabacillus sp. Hm71]|uniref:hypothetical protein n=1 Tax=Metabacillus sp. Hm71 TaxID=3450743 RepID=UPI003F4287DB